MPVNIYRTPASGVFHRKGFGFATCGNNRASVSQFVAGIGLKVVAGKRLMNLSDLVTAIDGLRQHGNLSSAIRLFVLDFYRSQAIDIRPDDNLREVLQVPQVMTQ